MATSPSELSQTTANLASGSQYRSPVLAINSELDQISKRCGWILKGTTQFTRIGNNWHAGPISMRFRQVKHCLDVLEQRFNESLLWPQGYKEPEHALARGHLLQVAKKFTCGSTNHIQFTCFKQWHSVISSITDNEGDPRDHPEGIVQKEHPPVAKTEWKNFHSIGKVS